MVQQFVVQLWRLPRTIVILLLRAYQATLSPDHGPLKGLYTYGYCRHEPTCSAYGIQVLYRRGLLIGTALLVWRVLGCHPWKKPSKEKMLTLTRM